MRAIRVLGTAALVAALPLWATAGTIVVPDDQPTIQDAVNAAGPGDTIQVKAGTYPESVLIDKQVVGPDVIKKDGLQIVPFSDLPADRPVVVPPSGTNGFWVKHSNEVVIRGLEIDGGKSGVRLDHVNGCFVGGLVVKGATEGVRVSSGSGHIIAANELDDSDGRGIRVDTSPGVQIVFNAVTNSRREGIRARNVPDAIVRQNEISDSRGGDGLRLEYAANATVAANGVVRSYGNGMRIRNASPLSLTGNASNDNRGFGIRLEYVSPYASAADVAADGNTATGNGKGAFRVQ